ncbi:hypothetical protein A3H53_00880 [Candidatus Nomurabacteria bacterium RIFCSPLOWO2_02_FULL_40_10]|uniref:ATP synthase subunit b n=2 Tax=Candidatus Nomuraibacteriota TaxID=1752729 RepID=A0A1F6XZN3_9BACT|nr:MAG: hypothetical protein A2642_01660 [Candidatus Nomurabacteria bacterium RIFCSPHIGHO2_01_FULL_39_10]OGI99554.1 MAG: hypothetical protein A3H53_00880 [Candidatus Nomurabacteria bacterium RIFCSPLOWO2_02_FULL_40_10]
MQEFIETFHIDWKLMIAQLFNFGIVFLAFYLLAAKPLRKLMKERGEVIAKGLADSKKAEDLLLQAKKESEQNIIKLRQISIESKKESTKELSQLREEHLAIIKADNDKWVKERVVQMEIDKKTIVESVKKDIVSLAVLMAQKLIGKTDHKFEEKEIKELHNLLDK